MAGAEACQNFQKERYAMEKTTDIVPLRQPESVEDPLTEIARDGARRMLAAALRAEADAFVAQHAEEILPDGRQRVVRHLSSDTHFYELRRHPVLRGIVQRSGPGGRADRQESKARSGAAVRRVIDGLAQAFRVSSRSRSW